MIRKHGLFIKLFLGAVLAVSLCAATQINYLDALIRQRIATTETQLSVLAMALEAYHLDHLKYPNDVEDGWPWFPTVQLTTPVAYVSPELFHDPFRGAEYQAPTYHRYWRLHRYINYEANLERWKSVGPGWIHWRPAVSEEECLAGMAKYGKWKLLSVGPDMHVSYDNIQYFFFTNNLLYDPTNGIDSEGDIIRYQKQ